MPKPSAKARSAPQPAKPLPIQNVQFTEDEVKDPKQFAAKLNVFFQQLVPSVQSLQGVAGPSVMPSGIDVAGQTVTGLGAPQGPTDAVSSGHADSQYSAEALQPQLDLGGKNALKGLTGLQITSNKQATSITAIQAILKPGTGISGTVTLAKITGGGSNGSLTFVNGIITAFTAPS
jgi:hypothetical protein